MRLIKRSLTQRHEGTKGRGNHRVTRSNTETDAEIKKRIWYCLVLALAASILLFSCDTNNKEPGVLHGIWESDIGDYYNIDLVKDKIEYGGFDEYDFKGDIHEVVEFTGSSGIIFFEYTYKGSYYVTAADGEFSGIYFMNLTSSTVEFSNPYDPVTMESPTAVSLSAAKAKFTKNNLQDYFGMTGAYKINK